MSISMEFEFSLPELQPVTIDPDDSALVIVDMENYFLKPGGGSYKPGRPERSIGNLVPLLGRWRASGGTVIFVHSLRAVTAPEHTVFGRPDHLIEGTWHSEIIDELKPLPGESVVRKRCNDCFNHTRMEQTLASLDLVPGRSQIVITGCATNVCVDCAVVGFSARDYKIWVPEDCTNSGSEENEMFGFAHYFRDTFYNVTPTRSDLISIGARELSLTS